MMTLDSGQMGRFARLVNARLLLLALLLLLAPVHTGHAEPGRPVRIVALGDSLTAGYGLAPGEAFPVQIERLLRARGHDVAVANAGVSGDTTAGGLARLDWAVPEGTDAVILELGANDALQARPPAAARANLDQILQRLRARGIEVLVAGMRAPRNLGAEYAQAFDPIFPELAGRHGALLYPFFLEGVALDPSLNLPDGIHPTAKGITIIADRMVGAMEALVARVKAKRTPKG